MKEIKKSASFKSKQKGKDVQFKIDLNYSPEYDSFIIRIKEGEGFMAYSSNIERMPLEVIQKLNEMLNEVLIKAGLQTEMKEHKMFDGGDFQAGVYAMGGSLQAHGIEVGDTFLTTISGNIQKVKDKNGKIVYVDLSNGKRDTQPPLPFNNGGMVSEDLFENYNKQPKKLSEIVNRYMKKYDKGEMSYQDTKNFLKEVEAIGYTFDYGLDNEPYGLRPIGTKLKEYDEGGEVTYFLNKDGIKVRSKVEPKKKLTEAEWMAKHNDSKEARTYGFGGGVGLIGNQKRIDMNKNGKIDAEDFKLLRASMNGAWRNERKHVNHNEDYEVRYARKKPSRTGYKGKRKFGEGGGVDDKKKYEIIFEDVFSFATTKKEAEMTNSQYQKALQQKNNKVIVVDFYNKSKGIREQLRIKDIKLKYGNGGGVEEKYVYKTNNKIFADDLLKYADLQNIKASSKKVGSYYYVTTNKKIQARESMPKELAKIVEGKKFKEGGGISTAERFKKVVAKNREANRVKPMSQKMNTGGELGKIYEVQYEVNGNKITSLYLLYENDRVEKMLPSNAKIISIKQKMSSGAEVKKANRGGVMVLAKKIRKDGES